jgi:hypothetical protein
MTQSSHDFFAFPKLKLKNLLGGLSLFLIGVNALTAVISIWTDGSDILGKIFWSSINLFFGVLIAYFLIEKLLADKGPVANTVSLLLLATMFLATEYLILKTSGNVEDAVRNYFAGFMSYVLCISAIGLVILISYTTRKPKQVEMLGWLTMGLAFLATNTIVYQLIVDDTQAWVGKLSTTLALLTIFSGIAIPVTKLLMREPKKKS